MFESLNYVYIGRRKRSDVTHTNYSRDLVYESRSIRLATASLHFQLVVL